jgi:exopolysaccharide biosynthesis polyprenyl glycosylphosphotransferase
MEEYVRLVQVSSAAMMLFVATTFFLGTFVVSRGWIVFSWVMVTVLSIAVRFLLRRLAYALRRRGYLRSVTLIVGADAEAQAIAYHLQSAPTSGADVVGFLDDKVPAGERLDGTAVLGPISSIQQVVARLGVEEILLSMASLTREQAFGIYETFCQNAGVAVRFSPGFFDILTTGATIKQWGSVPLVNLNKARLSDAEALLKACLDYAFASVTLIVLSPLLLVVALLVALDSPGPVLYRRRVLGRGGQEFDALKFRTMYLDGNEILDCFPELQAELKANHKLKNDPRVTPIGRLLRKYSLDEFPQFLNVLLGQMSVVGPRMISPVEKEKYGKMKMNLLTVKPGITGLWQISGRSDLSFEDRVRLDMTYIRNYSLWLDVMIILKTIPAALKGRGAY